MISICNNRPNTPIQSHPALNHTNRYNTTSNLISFWQRTLAYPLTGRPSFLKSKPTQIVQACALAYPRHLFTPLLHSSHRPVVSVLQALRTKYSKHDVPSLGYVQFMGLLPSRVSDPGMHHGTCVTHVP